jgi:hypothetical protein
MDHLSMMMLLRLLQSVRRARALPSRKHLQAGVAAEEVVVDHRHHRPSTP